MAKQHNISIDQGSDVIFEIPILDENDEVIDLTGYTAGSKIRKSYQSVNAVTFSASIVNNKIQLILNHVQTAAIVPGRYVFDVEVTSSSNVVSRVLEGICTIKAEATY